MCYEKKKLGPKPPWLKVRLGSGTEYKKLRSLLKGQGLHTVCEEALCPNMGRCWDKGRATVMILGDTCTRSCRFCGVATQVPPVPDVTAPERVAEAIKNMGLKDVVITSVTRDDLPDGGSVIWADTIKRVATASPGIGIEVLIPDFKGDEAALDRVITERPAVLAHNLETVARLYSAVRPQADYRQSLWVLEYGHSKGMIIKSGIMVGIGETNEEIKALMQDTVETGCNIFTIGQYLQPSKEHLPVERYVTPEEFEQYKEWGLAMGFDVVVSAPLVRSSYHSDEQEAFLNRHAVEPVAMKSNG
jgi:lipoic acid synthetase